jgi:DMSO reductase family type II enzyme heme b subunit
MVRVARVSADNGQLLDAAAGPWLSFPADDLALGATPLPAQPSLYVQASWDKRPYGAVPQVSVRALHNGESIFFRLAWQDDAKDDALSDTDAFADAAAVLFPYKDDAPLTSMGSPDQPVNAWYWRPDLAEPFSITAQGVGTTSRHTGAGISAAADYKDGAWALVIGRTLRGKKNDGSVWLPPGRTRKVAFGVWRGSNKERAGLKAVTLAWQPLEIEA